LVQCLHCLYNSKGSYPLHILMLQETTGWCNACAASTTARACSTGLYRRTRVSSHRTNMLESLGKTGEGPLDENSTKSPMSSVRTGKVYLRSSDVTGF
jgi:hypothetical protein